MKSSSLSFCLAALLALQAGIWAGTTGSISGTITDPSGSVIPGAALTVINNSQGIRTKAISDAKGVFTFPSLAVGQYTLLAEAQGFRPQRTGLTIDVDSVVKVDLSLSLAERIDEV